MVIADRVPFAPAWSAILQQNAGWQRILKVLNLEDTTEHFAPSRLRRIKTGDAGLHHSKTISTIPNRTPATVTSLKSKARMGVAEHRYTCAPPLLPETGVQDVRHQWR